MKNYNITEEQIKKLREYTRLLEDWFPEAFELKLEIGRWYKKGNMLAMLKCIDGTGMYFTRHHFYGFNTPTTYDNFCIDIYPNMEHFLTPATDSEVLEALTNEAIKRGFKQKTWFLNKDNSKQICDGKIELHLGENNRFLGLKFGFYNGLIMDNHGQWAIIIPTYTKEEAEKMLNAKIV